MFNIGPFLDYLAGEMAPLDSAGNPYPIILSGQKRPRLPYGYVLPLLSNQSHRYQYGERVTSIDTDERLINRAKQIVRNTQFSFTFVGTNNNFDAANRAQEFYDLLFRLETNDWLQARNLALTISGNPQSRTVVDDDFIDQRYGFDIQISDVHEIVEQVPYIETVDVDSDKTGNIIIGA